MNFSFIRLMACRYVWPKHSDRFFKTITLFSFVGIMLGVATLIVVMSVMNGFRLELSRKILDFNSHLSVYELERNSPLSPDFIKQMESLPEIQYVLPVIEGQSVILSKSHSLGVLVRAIPFSDFRDKSFVYKKLTDGSFKGFESDQNIIVIGIRLAQKLSLQVGDRITLISPKGNVTPFGTVPRFEQFKIGGFFEVGVYEYDQSIIFMPYLKAQAFFKTTQWGQLETYLHNPYATDKVIEKIQNISPSPLRFLSWVQAHASFFEVIQIERNVMFIILSLIILIAVFNIVSGLVILVKDKTMDIAILKTMGLSNTYVAGVFCMVGGMIGIVGTLSGWLLGSFISMNLETIRQGLQTVLGTELFKAEFYFLTKIPSVIQAEEVIVIVGMALVFSLVASLYPAYRATQMNPVEALRQNG